MRNRVNLDIILYEKCMWYLVYTQWRSDMNRRTNSYFLRARAISFWKFKTTFYTRLLIRIKKKYIYIHFNNISFVDSFCKSSNKKANFMWRSKWNTLFWCSCCTIFRIFNFTDALFSRASIAMNQLNKFSFYFCF